METIQTFLKKFDHIPPEEKPMAFLLAEDKFLKIKEAIKEEQNQPEEIQELMLKLLNDLKIYDGILLKQEEQAVQEEQEEPKAQSFILNWNFPMIDDDDDEHTILYRSSKAITPDLPTEELDNSLSMEDEHPNIISETESDEVINSSVENLVPTPSESEITPDNESEYDLPLNDKSSPTFTIFSNPLLDSNDDFSSSDDESFSKEDVPIEEFKIYSNPLFDLDEKIISSEENSISNEVLDEINSIPPGMNDCFNVESDLIECLLNRDTSIDSSHKIDSILDEFVSKLTLLKPISPEIDDSDFDPEGEIRLIARLLYDNSSPRPPEDLTIDSFSPSPIPVEDSDYFVKKIDIFLASDNSTPPGVEAIMTRKGAFFFLKNCLMMTLFPFPRGGEIDVFANVEDDDYFPFTFVIRIFLPYLTYPEVSPLLLSTGSEDTIFDPGIST
ncbi:hypothetical protein Tco_0676916 [Tanacetum coccineum]